MRVITPLLIALLPATSYAYTEGWQPGKAYTKYLTSSSSATAAIPTAAADPSQYYKPAVAKPALISTFDDLKRLFSLEEILTKGPVSRIAQRFGFNVTAQLEMAREGIPPRFSLDIPLLTDANYEEDLLNEQYASPEEEDERVWAIMCSIGTQDPVSSFFDKTFDGAHNLTVQAGDLKNVRWARIDYLEVTDITTRWAIWKAPVLIIAKDKGRELRFFKTAQLREMREPEEMREFLLNEEWQNTPPWSGPWSPRGSRAAWIEKYAKISTVVYNWLAVMPRWLLLLVTGTIASTIINFLHSAEEEKTAAAAAAAKKKAPGGTGGTKKAGGGEGETPEWAKEQELEEKRKEAASAAASTVKTNMTTPKKRKGGKK